MTHDTPSEIKALTPDEVGATYDEFGALYGITLGDSAIHVGQWNLPGDPAPARSLPELADRAMDRQTDWFAEQLLVGADTHLLDIGCGNGGPAVRIAGRTGARVTGITISRSQVGIGTERARAAGVAERVSFEHGDAMELPYPDASFDAAMAVDCICHMHDRGRALAEAHRVLRPGGRLLVTEFTPRGDPDPGELAVYHQIWATGPLLTPAQVLELADAAGWELVRAVDDTANLSMTAELMGLLYDDRRKEVLARYGAEAMPGLDKDIPLLRTVMRDYVGHVVFVLRKP